MSQVILAASMYAVSQKDRATSREIAKCSSFVYKIFLHFHISCGLYFVCVRACVGIDVYKVDVVKILSHCVITVKQMSSYTHLLFLLHSDEHLH